MCGLILTPAFGRDYADRAECMDDWDNGKEFRIVDGPLCTKADIPHMKAAGFNLAVFTNNAGLALFDLELAPKSEPLPCL